MGGALQGPPDEGMTGHRWGTIIVAIIALTMSGCAGAKLPSLQTASLPSLPESPVYKESPIEVYSRIARGALGCWFGPSGPLKATHVFNADVAPPSDNAGAEIVIHERDPGAPSPRSLRSFRIAITPLSSGGTLVASENLKLPAKQAADMEEDIRRWARGGTGCRPAGAQEWAASGTAPADAAVVAVPVRTVPQKR
jgi:hypothetical protein